MDKNEEIIRDSRILAGAIAVHGEKRVPSVYELAALGALKNGGFTDAFFRYLQRMHSVYGHYDVRIWWKSDPKNLIRALKLKTKRSIPVYEEIERLLKESNQALTPTEIARELGIAITHESQTQLAVILNLLSAMHIVRNQPNEVRKRVGTAVSAKWSHAGNKNPPITYPNTSWDLLQIMRKNPIFLSTKLKKQLKTLLDLGLAVRTTQKNTQGLPKIAYEINPNINSLLEKYDRTGEFPEALRRIFEKNHQRKKSFKKAA